jgi:2,4-dienoyl-CoA reductase-like NADH-dependent reductase (Old Yellow Enzyme family)/thioredoxin reductase
MSNKKSSLLFSPINIGTMSIKNRLVMPSMVRNYADANGKVTDRYVAHIERIAKGGTGMLVLEANYVRRDGKGFGNELGVHSNNVIPGLERLAKVAHKHGAKIGTQLYHAGRQTSSKTTGVKPVAPSPIPDPTVMEVPHELSTDEISSLVKAYAKGATRTKDAGLDFVEIHGAHGYLITQFLSKFSNKRKDKYGGSLENRMRFALEIIVAVREAVGDDFPIVMRLSADEMVPGGLTLSETKKIAKKMEQAGINALHISVGNYASFAQGRMIPPMAIEDGTLVEYAAGIKSVVNIPVITVGKIRTPKMADRILKKHQADLIAIGRTLLADPDWPNKVKEGRLDEINPCIACNQGCIGRLFAQQDVWCTVNPETGREQVFAKKAKKKKKVVIVGGGPAGMAAARTAAKRGHRVILYDENKKLGGQLHAAAAAPFRQGWSELYHSLIGDMKRLGVDVRLGKRFTPALAKRLKPNNIIVAIGSSPNEPNIPGIDRSRVFNSRQVLTEKKPIQGPVVVVGGGCAGAQTAEYLATKGFQITIVEAETDIAQDAPIDDRALLLERLKKHGVKILTKTRVMSIGEDGVVIEDDNGRKTLKIGTVVICLGSFPNNGLTKELEEIVKNVSVVGDAVDPRRVTEAMAEGSLAAVSI